MADNKDEKRLDISTNTQSESPSDEIIPAKDAKTLHLKQETGDMEVHHHLIKKKEKAGRLMFGNF